MLAELAAAGQAHGAGLQRSSRHPLQPGAGRYVFLPGAWWMPPRVRCSALRSDAEPGRACGAGDVSLDRPP